MSTHVVKIRRRGLTLATDTARAIQFGTAARTALKEALGPVAEADRPGFCRALVQEAVRLDEAIRGVSDARAWAAKQGRAA